MNSTHKVEVVTITDIKPHPNADKLDVVKIWGYTVCSQKGNFKVGDLGAYICPDSVVDTTKPEFEWLATPGRTKERIKVKKLRGITSQGFLMPAPEGSKEGDDVATMLGVEHYEPVISAHTGGETSTPPPIQVPSYDVEAMLKYFNCFIPEERVWVTEKIHGASGRWCYVNGTMYAGSKREWKTNDGKNIFWRALEKQPKIEAWCKDHPDYVLFGEIYGRVQDLTYGIQSGATIALFDILTPGGTWVPPVAARHLGADLPWVPIILTDTPFNLDMLKEMAEGPSLVVGADHIREGCVVKPLIERWDERCGRVCLKLVGNGYLERK